MMLKEGEKAPSFTIATDEGSFALKDSDKATVVFFFPKADTPGCTIEAGAFSRLKGEFDALGVSVIGISKDDTKKQGKFREKYDLTCALGADDDSDICESFGVWVEKSMYGKTFMGVARVTFVIDSDGIIRKIWPNVKVEGHAEEVLNFVREMA